MTKSLTIVSVVLLASIAVLFGCASKSKSTNDKKNVATELPVDISNQADSKFGLVLGVNERPGVDILEMPVLSASYIANNAYESEGQITLETLSIVHDDGSLLAQASINRKILVPSKTLLNELIELPIDIRNFQKFREVLESSNTGAGYQFEAIWRVEHPERRPYRRQVQF